METHEKRLNMNKEEKHRKMKAFVMDVERPAALGYGEQEHWLEEQRSKVHDLDTRETVREEHSLGRHLGARAKAVWCPCNGR